MWQQFVGMAQAVVNGGQDFSGMDLSALNANWNAAQNAQMQQGSDQIVQQTMQNPVAQQAYRDYLARGGRDPFPQFAFDWAAQGSGDPEGRRRFQESERQNQLNEQRAWQGVRAAEDQRAHAISN